MKLKATSPKWHDQSPSPSPKVDLRWLAAAAGLHTDLAGREDICICRVVEQPGTLYMAQYSRQGPGHYSTKHIQCYEHCVRAVQLFLYYAEFRPTWGGGGGGGGRGMGCLKISHCKPSIHSQIHL